MKNRGGARKGAGRKKGIGLANDIQKYCQTFIEEILKNDAIKHKAVRQLSLKLDVQLEDDYLYVIKNKGLYKIGYTSNWKRRLKNYKIHLGDVNIIFVTKQFDCFSLENELHKMFSIKRINGEWFELSKTELLNVIKHCSNRY